jgi:hypothetical protein
MKSSATTLQHGPASVSTVFNPAIVSSTYWTSKVLPHQAYYSSRLRKSFDDNECEEEVLGEFSRLVAVEEVEGVAI